MAAVLARLIRKGLELLAELDAAAAGHLRRLEGLLPSVWRVLDAADAGAVDLGGRPLQDLLDAAYAADDALDDMESAAVDVPGPGDGGVGAEARPAGTSAGVARKPRSPLRFLLCFSPPRTAGRASSSGGGHGKGSKAMKTSNIDLDPFRDAIAVMVQAAYRCTSAYETVVPEKNYATVASVWRTEDAAAAGETEQDDIDIFGREAEVEQILRNVRLSDDPHYRLGVGVLPVTGDAGVGKTALVHFVFHHQVTKAEFPVRVWVHVSGPFRLRKQLMDQMIHAAAGGQDRGAEDARELLHKELAGKRFLLVLDGVTDVVDEQWRDLMEVLRPAARRSLIIVTTGSETVATATGTMPMLILRPLGSDDYLKVFTHFAFGRADDTEECTLLGDDWDDVVEDEEELSPMEKIASELAKRMVSQPLSAQALGQALCFRQDDEDHWRNVLEDKLWESQNQDAFGISPALWLSYRHLDPRLKQCFAYCAVLPGDYVFRKEELVNMWVSQGLIYSDRADMRLEDNGGEFFDELVQRCFIQPLASNRFVMQKSMLDLARAVAMSRFFMVTDESSGDIPQEVRHLTIRTSNLSKLKSDLALQTWSSPDNHFLYKVRTVLLFTEDVGESDEFMDVLAHIFSMAKSVRVLVLSCENITCLPPEISQLRHLRYLNLSGNKIIDLQETLCQLYNLQVLDVRSNSSSLHPPDGITNLINLRHLYASELFLSSISDLHGLSNLQQLDVFRVGGSMHIDALRRMTQLGGKLHIGDLCQVGISVLSKGILKGMQHLNELQLSWSSCDGHSKDEEVLECLQPHDNLKVLRIMGYGGIKFPSWMMKTSGSLLNVTSMYLSGCTNCKILPPLHLLPSLEVLQISRMHSISKVSTVPQRSDQEFFLKLKRLVIETMPHCTEWSTGNSKSRRMVFPYLCELDIRNCPKLTIFPDLPLSLTVMIVENVGFETLPRIHDKQPLTEEALEATSKEGRWTSRLTTLRVHQCHRLRSLSTSLLQQQHLLKSLELLSIKKCNSVICDIPDGLKDLTELSYISLYDCPKMVVYKFHTSVRTVEISECFVAHGGWADEDPFLFSVWNLKITGCSHVSSDQVSKIAHLDWLSSLLNVYNLHLENTVLLRLYIFDQLSSLEILEIDGCDAFFDDLSDFSWLEKLQVISIRNCREMSGLPENLCMLPALEELCVQHCPAIEELPVNGLPTSLKRLSISNCGPRLTEQCLHDELIRPKIALIGTVYIDGKYIQPK